jgi:hypothetical protein
VSGDAITRASGLFWLCDISYAPFAWIIQTICVGTYVPPPDLSPLTGLNTLLCRLPSTSSPFHHPSTRKPRVRGTPASGLGRAGLFSYRPLTRTLDARYKVLSNRRFQLERICPVFLSPQRVPVDILVHNPGYGGYHLPLCSVNTVISGGHMNRTGR